MTNQKSMLFPIGFYSLTPYIEQGARQSAQGARR
jgi:hypothetical protein